jgi:hypothetical protein
MRNDISDTDGSSYTNHLTHVGIWTLFSSIYREFSERAINAFQLQFIYFMGEL